MNIYNLDRKGSVVKEAIDQVVDDVVVKYTPQNFSEEAKESIRNNIDAASTSDINEMEEVIEEFFPVGMGIDSSVFFENNLDRPLKKLELEIEPTEVTTEGVTTNVGFNSIILSHKQKNLWNEIWAQGAINSSTGANSSATTYIRSQSYIPIKPNTTYVFNQPIRPVFYNVNRIYIIGYGNQTIVTSPSDAHYLRFCSSKDEGGDPLYGGTYKHDISIYEETEITSEYTPYINEINYYNPDTKTDGYIYNDKLEYVANSAATLTDFIGIGDINTIIIKNGHVDGTQSTFIRINFFSSNNSEAAPLYQKKFNCYGYQFRYDINDTNVKYVRISFNNSLLDLQSINLVNNYSLEQPIYIGPYTGLNYTWEQGSFTTDTGELEDGTWTVRTNYFKVVPSSKVRVVFNRKCTRIRWIFKDVNGSIIAGSYYNTSDASGTYDISVNSSAEYMMIGLQKGGDSAPIPSEQFFPQSIREIDVRMFMYEGTLPSDMNIYSGKLDVLSGKLTADGSVYYLTPQQVSPFLGSNYFHNSTGKTTVEYYAHPVEPTTPDSYYLDCTVTSTSRTFSWKPLP